MAGSRKPGSIGTNPWYASPVTPGALGTNKDGGDPSTPDWFVGDTPGSTGHKDKGDPDGKMCEEQTRFDYYFKLSLEAKKQECEKVRAELAEAHKIRDAFLDPELLKEAQEKDWSGGEYNTKVGEKVFGKPTAAGEEHATFLNPMFTDPYSCRIVENWDHSVYAKKGLPDVVYEADKAHEKVHRKNCLADHTYAADMSFPEKLSKDEVEAYTAKIQMLEKWLADNCK